MESKYELMGNGRKLSVRMIDGAELSNLPLTTSVFLILCPLSKQVGGS